MCVFDKIVDWMDMANGYVDRYNTSTEEVILIMVCKILLR